MNDMLTVSEVSRTFGVSTRMLRHYEKLGLIGSARRDDYAYRMYTPEDVRRLRQILLLRKLRISLREIGEILADPGPAAAVRILEDNLAQMDEELHALETVRSLIAEFLDMLKKRRSLPVEDLLLQDSRLITLADALSPSSTKLQEERRNKMEQMENAAQPLRDVRIVYLPASEVAAAHFIGEDPEDRAGEMLSDFVRGAKLWEKHPGLRVYGFNHPNPMDETGFHGYEFWVTIPDGTQVPAPLVKKYFPGGTYAAHMIRMGDFQEWELLESWVQNNEEYEYAGNGDPEIMFGALEEHLNFHEHIRETPAGEPETIQLDLLIPVRKKAK